MSRPTLETVVAVALLVTAVLVGAARAQAPDARQVHWQRSVADALWIARAEHRPLLVALNMDGESASDRIVHEEYRDPGFVAATRECVCVVGSVFRHNARDHDDAGRRIPCPRLGEITCGEHIAMEPQLFEQLLRDDVRVAPRHVLILPDGERAFDLSLNFDLRDVDRALIAAVRALPPRTAPAAVGDQWVALACRADHRGRSALEQALADTREVASLDAALAALARHGDSGARDALRVLAARWPSLSAALRDRLLATAAALDLRSDLAAALRDGLHSIGALPHSPFPEHRASLLPGLAAADGATPGTRSLLLAFRAFADAGAPARDAVRTAFGAEADAIEAALADRGGPVSLGAVLQVAAVAARAEPDAAYVDDLPDAGALTDRLERLDALPAERRDDPAQLAAYAEASLDLARRHLETGENDVPILLEDAEQHFRRALDQRPGEPRWWIERARTAYFLTRFDRQIEFGQRALAAVLGLPVGELPAEREPAALAGDARGGTAVEALRWIGDGHARLLGARAGGDPGRELAGMVDGLRALGLVAASPFATAKDWLSLSSLCGALGLWREELAVVVAGATRFPSDVDLRQALNAALWNGGRIELAPGLADDLALQHLPTADGAWFAGYAGVLAAEDARRREDPEAALALYARSEQRFAQSVLLEPGYAGTCSYWIAMDRLGSAFAHLRAQRRAAAADAFVAALRTGADVTAARDGLGYDAFDLVDKLLEWRASGPSSVDAIELLDRIDAIAPDTPFWASAISDAALREALRADGRNPQRTLRDTVDAAGRPVRMELGLPTALGDEYLQSAVAAGRRAAARAGSDDDRRPLAQASTIVAERQLVRGSPEGVREALAEAARCLGRAAPGPTAGLDELRALAAGLRAELGDARPRYRPGR
ncbi:MAG: hypothetical protein IPM29_30350 [Planctomycetes bacterium]|nr:hypothetical protein [Planctomycetota bacterium]